MRLYQITETPIEDLQFKGDLDTEGSFRPDDLRAFRNPKWEVKVRNAFFKTPFKFNLYFYNGKDGKIPFLPIKNSENDQEKEEFTRNIRNLSLLKHYAGELPTEQFLSWFKANPKKDEISIVLLHNEGAGRLPLTPWVLAHRLGHAMGFVGDQQSRGIVINPVDMSNTNYRVYEVMIHFENLFSKFLSKYRDSLRKSEFYKNFKNDDMGKFALSLVGRSKAVRENNLVGATEFMVELIAEYLIKGEIKLNIPPNTEDNIELKLIIRNYERDFNEVINELLTACVGKIIVI